MWSGFLCGTSMALASRSTVIARRSSMARLFVSKDLEVLELTLGLVPDLREVAVGVTRARRKLRFPVSDIEDVCSLIDAEGDELVEGRVITPDDVRKYLTKDMLPIDSELEFARKLLIAFQRGRIHQYLEKQEKLAKTSLRPEDRQLPLAGPRFPTSVQEYDKYLEASA